MRRALVLEALLSIVSLCHAESVHVDFDHATHFVAYRSYSWAHVEDPTSEDAAFPNQLMRDRIIGFIEEALAAKGLRRVTSGGDLLISYRISIQERPEFTTFSDGFGPGWGWGWTGGISTTTVQTFYDGTLAVDIVDASKRKLVFQGTSTQEISSKPPANTKKLAKAVNKIFKYYPPQL